MPSEDLLRVLEDNEALLADGFEDALVGYDAAKCRAVYSIPMMIAVLMERDGMDEDEAVEFLEFNTFQAFVGDMTPLYLNLDDSIVLRKTLET